MVTNLETNNKRVGIEQTEFSAFKCDLLYASVSVTYYVIGIPFFRISVFQYFPIEFLNTFFRVFRAQISERI